SGHRIYLIAIKAVVEDAPSTANCSLAVTHQVVRKTDSRSKGKPRLRVRLCGNAVHAERLQTGSGIAGVRHVVADQAAAHEGASSGIFRHKIRPCTCR